MANKLGFARLASGSSIADIQQAVNNLYTASGVSESTSGTVYNAPSNTISNGDNYETALGLLADKFDPATGHMHTGAAGDAPPIAGSAIQGVPLMGFIEQGTTLLGVTGSSTDVSSQMSGKNASSNSTTLGVVVNSPSNKLRILIAGTGSNAYQQVQDDLQNLVYGRITASAPTGGTWTLSYYSEQYGVETPYTFPATGAEDLFWWYQELFNPMSSTSVYNPTMELFSPATGGGSGSGGGGGSLIWIESANSAAPVFENNIEVYAFEAGLSQSLYTSVKVPNSYAPGSPISLKSEFYSSDTSGNVLFQTVATLIRTGVDAITSTTNQRTSTNSAVTLGAGTVNIPQAVTFDLSSSIGQINGVLVSPNDTIIVQLLRGTDTSTVTAKHMVFASEVTFS